MELVRHRVFSFTQESTRYCNYSKDKFGNELTFIIPCWMNLPEISLNDTTSNFEVVMVQNEAKEDIDWITSMLYNENFYIKLLDKGWKPQQARVVLPNSLKTELIMTGFISDWKHFLKLRCDKSAHPQAQELANMLLDKTQIFN